MGAVPPSTIEEKIINRLNLHEHREAVSLALAEYRSVVRGMISDSVWHCFIHEDMYSTVQDCSECQEAKEVNVILRNLLQANCLNENPYSS